MLEDTRKQQNNIISSQKDLQNEQNDNEFSKAFISGEFAGEFEFSHECHFRTFYKNIVKVQRKSGIYDYIPILVSDRLIEDLNNDSFEGRYVEVGGQFRSYNRWENDKSHLDLFLYATTINVYESEDEIQELNENIIYLDGYITRPPIYRITPLGRAITDLMVAVNRNYNKSDYIPCIAWSETAKYVCDLRVGSRIRVYGRIQSREYLKKYSKDSEEGEIKVAYEVSINRIQIVG